MLKLAFLLFTSVAWAMYDGQTDVLSLDSSNFDEHVGGDKPAFVEFYAPWCGHCKHLTPEYEKLASSAKSQAVKIVAVDADKHRDLESRFGVSGFPTLKYFPAHSTEGEAYSGGRTAKDIATFINGKAGTNIRIKEAPTAVTVLTDSSFDDVVLDENKHVLVEFYAPWCGHCKKLAPDYEKLAKIFNSEPDVVIANLDATENSASATRFGVSGYPTIKWFPKDNKDGVDYNEGRSLDDFVQFINTQAGTERKADGGFLDTAGRIPELDVLVEKFLKNPSQRSSILAEAEAFIATLVDTTKAGVDKAKAEVGHGVDKAKAGVDKAKEEVGHGVDKVKAGVDKVKAGVDKAKEDVGYGVDKVKEDVGYGVDKVKEQVGYGVDRVKAGVDKAKEQVGLGVDKAKEQVGLGVDKAKEQVGLGVDKAKEQAGKAKEQVDLGVDKVKEQVGLGVDKAKEQVGLGVDKAKEQAGLGVDNANEEASLGVDKAKAKVDKAKAGLDKAKAELAKFYKVNMKKVLEKGDGHGAEETSRLERLISTGNIAAEKLGEFYKRINIARLFKL